MWFGGESAAAGGRAGRPRVPLSEPFPPAPLGGGGKRVLREKFSREQKLQLVCEEGAGGAASGGVSPPRLRVEVSAPVWRSLPLCVESRPGA